MESFDDTAAASGEVTEATGTAETAPAKAPRRQARFDLAAQTVTLLNDNGEPAQVFDAKRLPANAQAYALLAGMWTFIRSHEDLDAAYDRLVQGDVPMPREPKGPALSPWRKAIANALVEATKKTDTPLTPEQADARAATLDRVQLAKAKTDPLVVKHYQKLTGGKDSNPLLALIG